MIKKIIFRQYDIRGGVPNQFTAEDAKIIANAFGKIVKNRLSSQHPQIIIGRDIRTSSLNIHKNVIQGLLDAGIHITDIGVCPTPLVSFATHTLKNCDASIMITGSHNPPEDNGLKFTIQTSPFHSENIQHLHQESLKPYFTSKKSGTYTQTTLSQTYVDWNNSHFTSIPLLMRNTNAPFKIVIDAGNGTASTLAPVLLRSLNINFIPLFCEEDGNFPNHHPDPTSKQNLNFLSEAVRHHKADFGVAFDGDADRLGVVDENGNMIFGDQLLYIFAKSISSTLSPKVIADVKTSLHIYNALNDLNIETIMWKSGNPLIKDKLKETKAHLSGEMSAHYSFADRFFGYDDALYAMLRLIEIYLKIKTTQNTFVFSDLISALPKTYATPELRIDCPDEIKFDVISKSATFFTADSTMEIVDIITIDGIRIHLKDGWILVRASNTQPQISMRFEANSKKMANHYEQMFTSKVQSIISETLLSID